MSAATMAATKLVDFVISQQQTRDYDYPPLPVLNAPVRACVRVAWLLGKEHLNIDPVLKGHINFMALEGTFRQPILGEKQMGSNCI